MNKKWLMKVHNAVGCLISLGKLYPVVRHLCLTSRAKSTWVSHPSGAAIRCQGWRLSSSDGAGCVMCLWARKSRRWHFQNFRWHFPGEEVWLPLPVRSSGPFTAPAGSEGLFAAKVLVAVRARSAPAHWLMTLPSCWPWWMRFLLGSDDIWSSSEQAKMPQVMLWTDIQNISTCNSHQNMWQFCSGHRGSGISDLCESRLSLLSPLEGSS